MKTIVLMIIVLSVNVCKAGLAEQLASALSESNEAKRVAVEKLSNSVKSNYSAPRGNVVTLKDAAPTIVVEQDTASPIASSKEEEEVLSPQEEVIAQEVIGAKTKTAEAKPKAATK